MLLDPSTTIIKAHGKYAGPLAEIEVSAGEKKKEIIGYIVRERKKKNEPPGRIELPTPGLRDQCSTTEL